MEDVGSDGARMFRGHVCQKRLGVEAELGRMYFHRISDPSIGKEVIMVLEEDPDDTVSPITSFVLVFGMGEAEKVVDLLIVADLLELVL
jgi:hypothetical protein